MAEAKATSDVFHVIEHLFRRESGRLVAILTRRFGYANVHLAEDVVQDALVKAMQTWPLTGVPRNPSAWLLEAARNRALDQARRAGRWRRREPVLAPLIEECLQAAVAEPAARFEDEIRDSQLRMMLACCHPGLAREAQVALALRTLCGFGEREIAAAFLTSEAAVRKRLVRARRFLREREADFEVEDATELASRLEAVQQALYLLFNEGYKASSGDALLRVELCAEALRLGELLVRHAVGDRPSTHALLALMYFNAARLPARMGERGEALRLGEQDRTRWDRGQIGAGVRHLGASAQGEEVTRFHLEAGIAACHALAASEAATDWKEILALYDQLLAIDGSPVVALNRAVAVGKVHGAAAGLAALDAMPRRGRLDTYHLRHAVEGQLWREAGDEVRAAEAFRRAEALAPIGAEREWLARRARVEG